MASVPAFGVSDIQGTVMIVEPAGVDLSHESFHGKLFSNTEEIRNGQDDDGNGLIDDLTGFTYGFSSISDRHMVRTGDSEDDFDEHGTMVMSLAVKDISEYRFIPIGGNLRRKAFYAYIGDYIEKYNTKYVNMSLCFSVSQTARAIVSDEKSFRAARIELHRLVRGKKEVLFVVAGGNGVHGSISSGLPSGVNVDKFVHYPVSMTPENILAVGGVNTNKIKTEELSQYQLASFSNFGVKSIDILAPAVNLRVAVPGGYKTGSGLSFATPYVLNIILKVSEALPSLSGMQIKKIILRSAYVPKLKKTTGGEITTGYPVRSGGIVFPERINKIVELLTQNPSMPLKDAIIRGRQVVLAPEEETDLALLKELWEQRQI